MKKTCNGCRAHGRDYCTLGYKTKIIYTSIPALGNRTLETMIPLAQCPKPRTYKEYFLLKEKRKL